jgi:hypothetical protein
MLKLFWGCIEVFFAFAFASKDSQEQTWNCDLDCQHLPHPEVGEETICVSLGTF